VKILQQAGSVFGILQKREKGERQQLEQGKHGAKQRSYKSKCKCDASDNNNAMPSFFFKPA
jgi:hypothetical protein